MAVLAGFPTGNPLDAVILVEDVAGGSGAGVEGQQVALQQDNLTLKRLSGCNSSPGKV